MLTNAINNTSKYIESMPKAERKKYGQFFTSKNTAEYMANMYDIPVGQQSIRILDPGAGSGILTCAIIERLYYNESIKEIDITCYETDEKILALLKDNLEYCRKKSGERLTYKIITDNYITSQYLEFNHLLGANLNPEKYDLVIGNPPYMKLPKDAPEARCMPEVCYGAPNMYFLFSAMGLFNLHEYGELIFIIPRSWTSGAYFKAFRKYFLSYGKLLQIHLFASRDKVFDKESVLQETIIVKAKKTTETPEYVEMTSSKSNADFEDLKHIRVPYNLVVSGEDYYVYLITNDAETKVLDRFHNWENTLPTIGLKMKTGLTVDFRNWDLLRNEEEEGTVPLFYAQHIKKGKISFPINKEHEYVLTEQRGLVQDNKNYLFVKRFTAKEEPRRLQCGIYLSSEYPKYSKISTQNIINFIDGVSVEMSECLVYGLYVLFNSTLYDSYYRILNGSTQVNSTEINAMPVPDIEDIQEMGRILMKTKNLTEENCDRILEEYCA